MTFAFNAHFDGNSIIPDESVALPIGKPLRIIIGFQEEATHPQGAQATPYCFAPQPGRETGHIEFPILRSLSEEKISAEEVKRIICQTQLEEDIRSAGLD